MGNFHIGATLGVQNGPEANHWGSGHTHIDDSSRIHVYSPKELLGHEGGCAEQEGPGELGGEAIFDLGFEK